MSPTSSPHHRHGPQSAAVPVTRVIEWFITGWQLFLKNPGVWVLQTLIFIALNLMVGIMPVLGQILVPVLFPVFCAGMINGCARLTRGEKLEVAHLFDGFRRNMGNLIVLGGCYLTGGLIMLLVALLIGGSGALLGLMFGSAGAAGAVFGGMMFFGAVFYLLWILLIMALWFAPALVMLSGVAPLESLLMSLRACARNLAALVVTGIALYVVIWLAMLPAGLGVLVVMPVIAGAVYASWRDVFAHEFEAALIEGEVITDREPDAR